MYIYIYIYIYIHIYIYIYIHIYILINPPRSVAPELIDPRERPGDVGSALLVQPLSTAPLCC
jgi:hypothetical protein